MLYPFNQVAFYYDINSRFFDKNVVLLRLFEKYKSREQLGENDMWYFYKTNFIFLILRRWQYGVCFLNLSKILKRFIIMICIFFRDYQVTVWFIFI